MIYEFVIENMWDLLIVLFIIWGIWKLRRLDKGKINKGKV